MPVTIRRPVPERTLRDSYVGALGVVLLGALVTAVPVLLHLAGQPIAIALCVLLSLILTASRRPRSDRADLRLSVPEPVRRAGLAAVHQHRSVQRDPRLQLRHDGDGLARCSPPATGPSATAIDRRMRLMIDVTTGALVLIGAYFVLGVGANPASAVIYLRNIAAPFLLFQIFAAGRLSLSGLADQAAHRRSRRSRRLRLSRDRGAEGPAAHLQRRRLPQLADAPGIRSRRVAEGDARDRPRHAQLSRHAGRSISSTRRCCAISGSSSTGWSGRTSTRSASPMRWRSSPSFWPRPDAGGGRCWRCRCCW